MPPVVARRAKSQTNSFLPTTRQEKGAECLHKAGTRFEAWSRTPWPRWHLGRFALVPNKTSFDTRRGYLGMVRAIRHRIAEEQKRSRRVDRSFGCRAQPQVRCIAVCDG